MKEASWKECKDGNTVLKVSPDDAKSRSLAETARARIRFLEHNSLTADNANFIFEGYYSSVIEFLHSLVLRQGLKVMNHLCLGYYLRDVLEEEEKYREFDDIRYKRNMLIYYGKMMKYETAKKSIGKAKELIQFLN